MRRKKARDVWHMCKHLFDMTWAMRVCAHAWRCVWSMHRVCVHQKNVRATGECVYNSRRTHCSCDYMCTKPKKLCREKILAREIWTFITPWPSWQFFFQFVVWVRWVYEQNTLKIVRRHRSMFVSIFLAGTRSISSLLHQSNVSGGFSVSRGMRLWETDLPNLLICDDAFVWNLFPIV